MRVESMPLYADISLSRERLHEQIADRIQQLIVSRQLKPGDRLMPERELAEMLHVSRPTVRESLRLLQHRGMLTMKAGSGTYVTRMESQPIVESVVRFFSARDCSYGDLMQVREMLEPGAAALAALSATSADIENTRRRLEVLETAFASRDRTSVAEADAQFHGAIAHASGNVLLEAMSAAISEVHQKWSEVGINYSFSEGTHSMHRALVAAIAAHDPEQARAAALQHLKAAQSQMAEAQSKQ